MTDSLTSLDGALQGDSDTPAVAITMDSREYLDNEDETPTYSTRTTVEDRLDDLEGDTSDDVDPRRLVHDPSPSEIRWYYRNSPFAPTIVNKPVDDAFKHGYDVKNDRTGDAQDLLDEWEPHRRQARKVARRDGFAFIYIQFNDDADANRPPENVTGYSGFEVLDLGELAYDPDAAGLTEREIAAYVEYDWRQLRVLPQGIVVVEDVSSPDHHELVGVVKEIPQADATRNSDGKGKYRFLHGDRLQHFVENPTVDGNLGDNWVGELTGHPVLGPIFHELKGLAKTSWALGQALYRHSAPLHVVEIEREVAANIGDMDEHVSSLNKKLRNINSASQVTLPPGHGLSTPQGGAEVEPEPYVETLVEMVCAGSEFTKTVLMGTQSGTVSGSESDIKNYFNQVQRYRHGIAEEKMYEILRIFRTVDAPERFMPNFVADVEIDWGPLFKLDRLDTTESMVRLMTAVTNGVGSYLLTPEEARNILASEWASLGADLDGVELTALEESDFDQLDRVNRFITKNMPKGKSQEQEVEEGNPRVGQNGGGMEQGQSTSSAQPAADTVVSALEDALVTGESAH